MRYALVGYGISNKQLCKLLRKMGYDVFVSEARMLTDEEKVELESFGAAYEEGRNSELILKADRIVVSPSVKPNHPIISIATEKVVTDLDVVFSILRPKCIIGVTGTNGKTTTCNMLTHALRKLYKKVDCLGNVGNPVAKLIEEDIEYLVLELSSFQLFWAKKIPLDIGAILNISPNHLDWHPDFEHYYRSKIKLFDFSNVRVYNAQDPLLVSLAREYKNTVGFNCVKANREEMILELSGKKYHFYNSYLYTSQNLWNLSATLEILRVLGFKSEDSLQFLEDFKPPKHRMQFVGEINGISFYDDSKSTSAAATIAALENFDSKRVVLILTGRGKNEDYTKLTEVILMKAKAVVMFGEMVNLLAKTLISRQIDVRIVQNMEEAVQEAFEIADSGDVVLLSPAGSSFDLYRNYEERGEHFEIVVKSMLGG